MDLSIIIIISVFALIIFVLKKPQLLRALLSGTDPASDFPYHKQELLSNAEKSFIGVLAQAVGDKAVIFAKPRVADVIGIQAGLDNKSRMAAFGRIKSKHFDFVLCEPKSLSVVCAIELDDKSHNRKNRQERDTFLDRACEAAELPLIRIKAQKGYVISELKENLYSYLVSDDKTIKNYASS